MSSQLVLLIWAPHVTNESTLTTKNYVFIQHAVLGTCLDSHPSCATIREASDWAQFAAGQARPNTSASPKEISSAKRQREHPATEDVHQTEN